MRRDWFVFIAVAAGVAIFVYANIVWCLFAYRAREGRKAATFSGNAPLEILYAAIPLLIVAGLFALTYAVEVPLDRVATRPVDPIAVTAFRWSWRFEYAGSRVAYQGTPAAPPTLYLPVNRSTEIDLRSEDVTHSFWVPAFLFKRDAIPGMTNVFDLTPNRLGTFLSRCAQFCGLEHAWMTFRVKVVPDAAYDRFVASRGKVLP